MLIREERRSARTAQVERLGLLHLVDLHIDLASRRIDMAQPLLRPISMTYIRAHVMAYLSRQAE